MDIAQHGGHDQERHRDPSQRHRHGRARSEDPAWAISARRIHEQDGKIIDNDDVVEGIVLLRKGANSDATLVGIHEKVNELNEHLLPPGVKIVPFLDRSDPGASTPRTRYCTT